LADLLLEGFAILDKSSARIGEEGLFSVSKGIGLFLLLCGHRLKSSTLHLAEFSELEFLRLQDSGHLFPYLKALTAN
jgi:hypothetical protein